MAIAWTTVASLVLLLPGFLFFTGLHAPSQFSRDTTPRSAVGQLAAIVLVSLTVHIGLIWVTRLAGLVMRSLPQVDLRLVLSALQAGSTGVASLDELSRNLTDHAVAIPLYLGSAAGIGFLVGLGTGKSAIGGSRLSFILEHRWVYDLVPPPKRAVAATHAFVLTKVREGERCLLYRGPLYQFGLRQDGQFAYLVLRNAERFYLKLEGDAPRTTAGAALGIGVSHRAPSTPGEQHQDIDFLYLNGDEISNVVFERYTLAVTLKDAIRAIDRAEAPEPSG
jgi:hypothetical protein